MDRLAEGELMAVDSIEMEPQMNADERRCFIFVYFIRVYLRSSAVPFNRDLSYNRAT